MAVRTVSADIIIITQENVPKRDNTAFLTLASVPSVKSKSGEE